MSRSPERAAFREEGEVIELAEAGVRGCLRGVRPLVVNVEGGAVDVGDRRRLNGPRAIDLDEIRDE